MNCICEGWINPWGPKEWSPQPSRAQTGAEGKEEELSDKSRQSVSLPQRSPLKKNTFFKSAQNFLCSVKAMKYFQRRKGEKSVIFMWQLWLRAQHGGRQMSHQASPEKSELQVSQEGLKSYRALSGGLWQMWHKPASLSAVTFCCSPGKAHPEPLSGDSPAVKPGLL